MRIEKIQPVRFGDHGDLPKENSLGFHYGAPLKEIPKDSFSLRAAALEKHVHALRARITHLGAAQRRESHILTASRSTRVLAAHQGAGTSLIF